LENISFAKKHIWEKRAVSRDHRAAVAAAVAVVPVEI